MTIKDLKKQDELFDKIIFLTKKPKQRTFIEYLNNLFFFIKITDDVNEFKDAIQLFRKWKLIVLKLYDYLYPKEIERSALDFLKPEIEVINIDNDSIKKKITQERKDDIIKKVTKSIVPYFPSFGSLSKVDPGFFIKYESSKLCEEAEKEYKQSNLNSAYSLFNEVIDRVNELPSIDQVKLFILAFAIHGLGNITLIAGDNSIANHYYKISLELKKKIKNLPKINIFATELKVIISNFGRSRLGTWIGELNNFYDELIEEDKVKHENENWFYNVKNDALYHLAKGYLYEDIRDKAERCLKESPQIARSAKDLIGLIRNNVLRGTMEHPGYNAIKEISEIINENKDFIKEQAY